MLLPPLVEILFAPTELDMHVQHIVNLVRQNQDHLTFLLTPPRMGILLEAYMEPPLIEYCYSYSFRQWNMAPSKLEGVAMMQQMSPVTLSVVCLFVCFVVVLIEREGQTGEH